MLLNREAMESIQKRLVTIKVRDVVWSDASFVLVFNQIPDCRISKCTRDKCSAWFACAELGAAISAEGELCGPSSDWEQLFLRKVWLILCLAQIL